MHPRGLWVGSIHGRREGEGLETTPQQESTLAPAAWAVCWGCFSKADMAGGGVTLRNEAVPEGSEKNPSIKRH